MAQNYGTVEKYNGTANYIEIMSQVNIMRLFYGNPVADIFSKLTPEKRRDYDNTIDLLYTQAHVCLANNKNKEAIKWLVTAKAVSPEDIRDSFEQANYYFKTGELEKATLRVNQFLKKAPTDLKGLVLLGMIYLEQEKFDEASKSFSKILNKKIAHFYLSVSDFCSKSTKYLLDSLKSTTLSNKDNRTIILLHMLNSNINKVEANKALSQFINNNQNAQIHYYSKYKLGTLSSKDFKKRLDYGPIMSVFYNFTIGFEAMQNGDKVKAMEHFKKCLIPYSIDLPEYHMAKACLKRMEK